MKPAHHSYQNMEPKGGSMKGIQLSAMAAVLVTMLSGCGSMTETYINQKDTSQTLELTHGKTLRALFKQGSLDSPQGLYILTNDQKVTSGTYSRGKDNYVLVLDGNKEFRIKVQSDSAL